MPWRDWFESRSFRTWRKRRFVMRSWPMVALILVCAVSGNSAAQSGPSVEWGTSLGGTGGDRGYGIAVDSSGNVYATGYTNSSGWVIGGWDTTLDGSYDG